MRLSTDRSATKIISFEKLKKIKGPVPKSKDPRLATSAKSSVSVMEGRKGNARVAEHVESGVSLICGPSTQLLLALISTLKKL